MSSIPAPSLADLAREAGLYDPPARGPARIRYTHDALVDLIIAEPWLSQNELASRFGYTPAWISTVIHSDAFQARLAARREEVVDPILKMQLEERCRAVIARSWEVLMEKMAGPAHTISDNVALRVAEMGGRIMAAKVAHEAPQRVENTERLSQLAERLRKLQRPSDPIEVIAVEVPNEASGT